MILSLDKDTLIQYVIRQLEQLFPDDIPVSEIGIYFDEALTRLDQCFSAVSVKYFKVGNQTRFNHLHSDQYAMFLYFLSNTLYRNDVNRDVCDKLYYLNKALHGIDVFYEVELPDIFMFGHCVGTVIGRAKYSDYLLIQQNCTIGAAREAKPGEDGIYPVLGKYLAVYAGASILGNCMVGQNCKISAHSLLLDQNISANSIYIGTPASHIIKINKSCDNVWNT